jgi:Tfp pilus assembly protein PilN
MHELEFLPDWYPRALQRRRLLRLEAWMLLILLGGLCAWALLVNDNVKQARAELSSLQSQMSKTDLELERLDDLLALQKQWHVQDQIIARLGGYLEVSRLVGALDRAMPPNAALTELRIGTRDEAHPPGPGLAGAARATIDTPVERRVRIVLNGVAPSDVDLADLLARLTSEPLFEQVAMSYARDRVQAGHVLREFQITFSISLGAPSGG